MNIFQEQEEILDQALSAKREAEIACGLDEARNYLEAIQRYDQAVFLIDEILKRISSELPVWEQLVMHRQTYSDRMEELREHLKNEVMLQANNRKNRRLSRVPFDDKFDPTEMRFEALEEPPNCRSEISYWLMRMIRTTILTGGYISPDVFVPKCVWTQLGAKFHALNAKMSALEHLMILLTTYIYPLEYPDDVHSAEETKATFTAFYREMVILQNNLSKPFTYIHEIPLPGQVASPPPTTQVGKLTSMFSTVGKNVMKYAEVGYQRIGAVMKARASDQELANYVSLASELCEKCQILDGWLVFVQKEIKDLRFPACQTPASEQKHSLVTTLDFTSLHVGSENNLLRKSFSSDRPERAYGETVSEDIVKVQSTSPRTPEAAYSSPRNSSPHASPRDSPGNIPRRPSRRMSNNLYEMEKARVVAENASSEQLVHSPGDPPRLELTTATHSADTRGYLEALENLLRVQENISVFMRDVFCEILLQDVEYLLCRYLKKTRKGLAHMFWDIDSDSSKTTGKAFLDRQDSSMSIEDF